MTIQCPIPRILLPVDGSENSKRAVEFTGHIGKLMGESLSGIALLHVLATSHIGKHTDYIDFRAENVKQSETIKGIRKQNIEQNIKPFMDAAEKILRDKEITAKIEHITSGGDPVEEITRFADEGGFSTIMMARRGYTETKRDFLKGITSKVVHAVQNQTVYVIGYDILKEKGCPDPLILVPVDGSPFSRRGVEHAACLASMFKESLRGVTLFRVINVERTEKKEELENEAQILLDEARKEFLKSGIPESLITIKSTAGMPGEEIVKEADQGKYNLVFIGRKGRSTIKDLILGGVSSNVLQNCRNATVAVVSGK